VNGKHRYSKFVLSIFSLLIITSTAHVAGENYSQQPHDWVKPGENVLPNQIYIKILQSNIPLKIQDIDGIAFTGISSLDAVADAFGVFKIRKAFILQQKVMDNPLAPDLDRWYIAHFPEDYGLLNIYQAYSECPEVEFPECSVIYKTCFTPNDPQFHRQWHLVHCGFPAAWDVSHGSEEIIVGIIDSGIDMEHEVAGSEDIHEDLRDNIWVNPGEDINGDGVITFDEWDERDNDENGYVDDFFGWDFVGEHNWPDDPNAPDYTHGTHVASDVSAVTNNEIGVAGTGFSCKVMVAGVASRQYRDRMENIEPAIIYCSSNGAKIINLSFGAFNPVNRIQREAIEFAQNEGSIIFAAAGNHTTYDHRGLNHHVYPCAYDGVIGVAASDSRDRKADFSNWGDYIDLVAPGLNVLGCWGRGDYSDRQGTSFSSPLAAGLGALMLSIMPDLTSEELLERMQATATDISDLNEDYPGVQYRINADFLLNSTHPKFEVIEWEIQELEGDNDRRIERHERVTLQMTICNIPGFTDASNVSYQIQTDDPVIRFERNSGVIGDLGGGDSFEISADQAPIFRVTWCHPHYSTLNLTVTSDEGWDSIIEFPLTIGSPYYLLIDDDGGGAIETYYIADLAVDSFVHDTWDIEDDRHPDQDWFNEFEIVIWETGNARNALSEDEISLLEGYLDSGGALILIGQYIGNDHGDSEFFSDYLHVRHLEDDGGEPQINGVEGNPISDGQIFLLFGDTGAGNDDSPSTMEPLEGAETLFTYRNLDATAVVYYENDTYKIIYMGFALEAASGIANTTQRHEFFEVALNYLYEVGVNEPPAANYPRVYDLSEPWPNPFNNTVNVKVNIPFRSKFQIEVLDINGRIVKVLYDGFHSSGEYDFIWDAMNTSAGEYFFRMSWEGGSVVRKMILLK